MLRWKNVKLKYSATLIPSTTHPLRCTPKVGKGRDQHEKASQSPDVLFKGTVSRDFLLLVFFMNQFPPSPRVFHLDRFDFFRKFTEIFAGQGAPPVSTTPVANFYTIFASVVDTGGKYQAADTLK